MQYQVYISGSAAESKYCVIWQGVPLCVDHPTYDAAKEIAEKEAKKVGQKKIPYWNRDTGSWGHGSEAVRVQPDASTHRSSR